LLFLIVFLWTPPHFWSLALVYQDDYKKVGYPMMPVVKGEDYTLRRIVYYSILLLAVTFLLAFLNHGLIFWLVGLAGSYYFMKKVMRAFRIRERVEYRKVFSSSIVYLFVIFIALITDAILKHLINV